MGTGVHRLSNMYACDLSACLCVCAYVCGYRWLNKPVVHQALCWLLYVSIVPVSAIDSVWTAKADISNSPHEHCDGGKQRGAQEDHHAQ